jgi:hypothetical protein
MSVWDIPSGGFDTYREAAPHMRRPFTAEAVRWKVQSAFGPKDNPNGGLIVGYIDARLVVERLNLLAPHLWQATYTQAGNLMWCHLTVDGITRSDVGESSKGFSKDQVSDALKRAAVHFGVGVSIYAVPQARLFTNQHGKHIEVKGQKKQVWLTDAGHAALKKRYQKWLDEHGTEAFGPALSHGDIEPAIDPPDEAPAPVAVDSEVEKLRDDARRGYDALCKITPGGAAVEYFAQAFVTDLEQAGEDAGKLADLIARVDGLVQEARVKELRGRLA